MGHSHGPEALITGIILSKCSMKHHSYGYSDHILDCILFYPIVVATYHSNVPDSLALDMHLSGKLFGIVDTITCGVSLHCKSCTHDPL